MNNVETPKQLVEDLLGYLLDINKASSKLADKCFSAIQTKYSFSKDKEYRIVGHFDWKYAIEEIRQRMIEVEKILPILEKMDKNEDLTP